MESAIVLAQTASAGGPEANLAKAKTLIARASQEYQPDLMVFPEVFMSCHPLGTPLETVWASAQPLDGPFVTAMRAEAKRHHIWLVFGMIETGGVRGDPRAYNTTVILNSEGGLAAFYRKTHLYDAFGYRESDTYLPGDKLFAPIDTPFGRIGLLVCYEIRFPEIARFQRAGGADIILMPAAWADGKLKSHHFHTMIRARAMENTVFLCACDMCSDGFIGESCFADPMGVPIAMAGEGEQLLSAVIDTDRLRDARLKLPCFEQRRPELYTGS